MLNDDLFHRRHFDSARKAHLAALISRSWYCACWLTVTLTGTLEYNRAIVSVNRNTCVFPAVKSQNVYCEKSLLIKDKSEIILESLYWI